MKRTGSLDHQGQGGHRWRSQVASLASRFSESPSAVFGIRLRSGAPGGHVLPVFLVYWHRCCAKLVAWILFSYCEYLACVLFDQGLMPRNNRDKIDEVSQSVSQSDYHGDPSAALLEVYDPK